MPQEVVIFWFRRDLRLHDNAGLYHALRCGYPVVPVCIFDTNILNELKNKHDKRVAFIYNSLAQLQHQLTQMSSTLHVVYDTPIQAFKTLLNTYNIKAVYTNDDYEPYAISRDKDIADFLATNGIAFHSYKDQVIFEKGEVLKDDGTPYTVYTPYSKRWKALLNDFYIRSYPTEKYFSALLPQPANHIPSLREISFEPVTYDIAPAKLNEAIATEYHDTRNFPAVDGTTKLSVHLRYGTISIRQLVAQAKALNETLLNEFIWREFYQMILYHFPHVVNHSFRKEYDNIQWRNNGQEFERWCNGETGYPIVDAGMRELNATGYMHNRVRMIVASFLTKDLLIDWRWGEAYFAEKLMDYDLAANNGNWQWAAGTGCDAAPYFRIFNPGAQAKKFDPDQKYIKRWAPEWNTPAYVQPIVDHRYARERCLKAYKTALSHQ